MAKRAEDILSILPKVGLILIITAISFFALQKHHENDIHDSRLSILLKGPARANVWVMWDVGRGYYDANWVALADGDDFLKLEYKLPASPIKRIRIDPGDSPADFHIKQICLNSEAKSHCWQPGDIARDFIPISFISDFSVVGDSLHIRSTGNDPAFENSSTFSKVQNEICSIERRAFSFTSLLIPLLIATTALVLCPSVSVLKTVYAPHLILPAAMFGIFALAAKQLAQYMLSGAGAIQSASFAVGAANYAGYSKPLEVKITLALLALSAGVALIFILADLAFVRKQTSPRLSENIPEKPVSLIFIFPLAVAVILAGYPDIKGTLDSIPAMTHLLDWDGSCVFVWEYQYLNGQLPYKDFWYPYQGIIDRGFLPLGALRAFAQKASVHILLFISIYLLAGKNRAHTIMILGSLWILSLFGIFNVFAWNSRYGISLNIMLLFATLIKTNASRKWYILFGLYMGLVSTILAEQLVYSAPALIVLAALYLLIEESRPNKIIMAKNTGIAIATMLFCTAIYLAVMAHRGQLANFMDFYLTDTPIASVYSSVPGDINSWVKLAPLPENQVFWSVYFFIMYGMYLVFSEYRRPRSLNSGVILLGIGLLTFVIFQKHLVRPHMAKQFNIMFFIGMLFYCRVFFAGWSIPRKLAGGALLAVMVIAGVYSNNPQVAVAVNEIRTAPAQVTAGYNNFLNSVPLLFLDETKIKELTKDYFAPSKIKITGSEQIVEYFDAHRKLNPNEKVFAFPDMIPVYPLIRQLPPPYLSVYNASTIYAQRTMIKWLDDVKPELTIWNYNNQAFDGVPNIVRVPIIYNYIIANYEPVDPLADYYVLKRRGASAQFDIDFWKKMLGDSINLGYIPAISNAEGMEACYDSECHEFMKVTVDNPAKGTPIALDFDVAGRRFKAVFNQMEGQKTYYIYLTRLWFWGVAKSGNFEPKYVGKDGSGVTASIFKKRPETNVLYPQKKLNPI